MPKGVSSSSNWDRVAGLNSDGQEASHKFGLGMDSDSKDKNVLDEGDLKTKLQQKSGVPNPNIPPPKLGCTFCRLKNHKTNECKRRNACELCGFNNHNSFDCCREPLWNYGPELCAAQVPD